MGLTDRSRILFLVFAVLGIYYASLFGEINTIDDQQMIGILGEYARSTDWKELFIPKAGTYYRPLLWSSYIADAYLWDLSESFMHLENILLHAANTVLVFILASRVLPRDDKHASELPLLTALIFAWHPINTESVAWISGRTDPMAALFVLASAIFLLKGLDRDKYGYFVLSTGLLLLGCLCKEVAVFFLPAACFIVLSQNLSGDGKAKWFSVQKCKRLALLVGPFFLCGIVYLYLRFSSFTSSPASLFKGMAANGTLLNSLRMTFKVFGFYSKKLFQPLPLNFAILEASNAYIWVGVVAILLLVLIASKRHIFSAFAVTAGILIVPAILVSLTHVAWTPLAERYLYLPSAFFAVALVGAAQLAGERFGFLRLPQASVALLLVPCAFFTAQRTLTWQSNLALYEDTLRKSPSSAAIKNELAIALAKTGRATEAERHLVSAMETDPRKMNAQLYLNEAELKVCSGDVEGARLYLLSVIKVQRTPSALLLRRLAKIDENRLFKTSSDQVRREIYQEIRQLHAQLFKLTGNSLDLYRGGQMAYKLGERDSARRLFEQAYLQAPDDAFFKPAARKLAEKMKQ